MASTKQASSKSKKKPKNKASSNGNGKAKTKSKKRRAPETNGGDWPSDESSAPSRSDLPHPLEVLSSGKSSPLLWALPANLQGSSTEELIETLHRFTLEPSPQPSPKGRGSQRVLLPIAPKSKKGEGARRADEGGTSQRAIENVEIAQLVEHWLARQAERRDEVGFALECLAWTYALPRLTSTLTAGPWAQFFELLVEVTAEHRDDDLHDDPLRHQLLTGELPLTLSHLFDNDERCTAMFEDASRELSIGLVDLTDGEGLPHAKELGSLPSLLACWTRCEALAASNHETCLDDEASDQYEWLVRQTIRSTRWDGSLVFSHDATSTWNKHLLRTALKLNDDAADDAVAKKVLPTLPKSKGKSDRRTTEIPEPSVYSEWSEAAIMRTTWKKSAPQLAVTFHNESYQCELSASKELIWSGAMNPSIVIDGDEVAMTSEWEEACWFSDEDVDYLELEVDLEDGWTLQRQMMLARQGNFVYFADNVIGDRSAKIDYSVTVPLRPGIDFQREDETREGMLVGNKRLALVMPLALPEWRSEPCDGELIRVERGLQLNQSAEASRLCAPLYFDLQPKRFDSDVTWRRLTVAEKLEIQSPEVAVGYRVQVAKSQWFFYRSLTPPVNRTLLGQNIACEFICAKFKKDGTLDELIEIE